MNNETQCDRLLACLQAQTNCWIPMPDLARACSPGDTGVGICVSRRIYDLRKRGYYIANTKVHKGGGTHSLYKLINPPPASSISPTAPVVEDATAAHTDVQSRSAPVIQLELKETA